MMSTRYGTERQLNFAPRRSCRYIYYPRRCVGTVNSGVCDFVVYLCVWVEGQKVEGQGHTVIKCAVGVGTQVE